MYSVFVFGVVFVLVLDSTGLVYLLLHASAARRHSERFGSTFLSFTGVWEAWNGPPLQGPEGLAKRLGLGFRGFGV